MEGRGDTDERILEAALSEFAHKGKDGARTQRIADAAGINKAMLHYYYRTKERLYEAAFDFVFQRLLASFGRSVEEADSFAVMLERFIDGYISFVRRSPVIARFLVAENLGSLPPNTGLLTIWDGEKYYQVHFSADMQTNASITIRRKKN